MLHNATVILRFMQPEGGTVNAINNKYPYGLRYRK